jgi:hypothetical protein
MVGGDAGMVVKRARIRAWHRSRYVAADCYMTVTYMTVTQALLHGPRSLVKGPRCSKLYYPKSTIIGSDLRSANGTKRTFSRLRRQVWFRPKSGHA